LVGIRSIAVKSFLICTSVFSFSSASLANDVRDYGEYLAGECTACHSTKGADKGIPSIIGWDTEGFIETLKYYKSGERDNPAMVDVAKNLDDEQMTALAVYFGSLEDKSDETPPAAAPKPAAKSGTTAPATTTAATEPASQ